LLCVLRSRDDKKEVNKFRAASAARKTKVNNQLDQISPFFEQDFLWMLELVFVVEVFVLGFVFVVVVFYS